MRAMTRDDDTRTARMISRGQTRKAGDRSTKLATQLMKLAGHQIKRLKLDDELRESIVRARAVTSLIARRRAERTLAGDLRRFDFIDIAAQVDKIHETGGATDVQLFHDAEEWRARMIEEGVAALATFPTGADDEWPRMIAAARRERDTGKPPGSSRALFRKVAEVLRHQQEAEEAAAEAADADAGDDADLGDERNTESEP